MKNTFNLTVLLLFLFVACEKDTLDESDLTFIPTDVFVKTETGYSIEQVFSFINSYEHEVETIYNVNCVSGLPIDSLKFVLGYLENKPYITHETWETIGNINKITKQITVFPKLKDMKNISYQQDWIQTIHLLNLKDDNTGYIILFHVPEGEELKWSDKFESYGFVEWSEPNWIYQPTS
jgi:hypothetical protein